MPGEVLDFEALEGLRNYLSSIRVRHVPTMNHFATANGKGFWHQQTTKDRASISSTATCISSIVRTGLWGDKRRKWGSSQAMASRLLEKPWTSAQLAENNPFSLSFIAQGVIDLIEAEPFDNGEIEVIIRNEVVPLILAELNAGTGPFSIAGSIGIDPYPPSAYLTQLAFRVLSRFMSRDDPEFQKTITLVRSWARSEVYRQLALATDFPLPAGPSRIADPLQLCYATILLSMTLRGEQTSPEEKALIRRALSTFFSTQTPDGTWPLSQPLFHYPGVGNAHCFEYELLSELLRCEPLQEELLLYLDNFRRSAIHLDHTWYELGVDARGWASGHHPQIQGPESWSTASVFDFVQALDRLLAEAIRRSLFRELRAIYTAPEPPSRAARESAEFAPGFLDAPLTVDGAVRSLTETIRDYFVLPIEKERNEIAAGGSLKRTTAMSAILYGPPGTSKTQLAKIVGSFLGWPVLTIDPSYLVQDGLDHLYARANRLFSMLTQIDQVVVLLDEFDELGRDRAQSPELLSRFITTSMLPKLVAINEQRKIVFFLATNYASQFDAAFSRGGRFDVMLQIMPPTVEAKLSKPEWSETLEKALKSIPDRKRTKARENLSDLTFLETEQLVMRLMASPDDPFEELELAAGNGTLGRTNGGKNWKQTSIDERKLLRLPSLGLQPPQPAPQPQKRGAAKKKTAEPETATAK